jgi:hypothetical protein
MADKTNREKLQFIVSHAKADANLCAVAYQIIKGSVMEERATILEEFVTGFRSTPTDGSMKLPTVITRTEERGLMERYGSYVDQKVEELIEDNLEEHEFYEKLAEFIVSDSMLQDGAAGAIAIFDCVIDKRFPYHRVDVSNALTMDQERYLEIIKAIGDNKLEQIDSALNYDFNQKTERASVVLSLIEARDSYEERVVMMSRVLAHFEREIMNMQMKGLKGDLLRDLLED